MKRNNHRRFSNSFGSRRVSPSAVLVGTLAFAAVALNQYSKANIELLGKGPVMVASSVLGLGAGLVAGGTIVGIHKLMSHALLMIPMPSRLRAWLRGGHVYGSFTIPSE